MWLKKLKFQNVGEKFTIFEMSISLAVEEVKTPTTLKHKVYKPVVSTRSTLGGLNNQGHSSHALFHCPLILSAHELGNGN